MSIYHGSYGFPCDALRASWTKYATWTSRTPLSANDLEYGPGPAVLRSELPLSARHSCPMDFNLDSHDREHRVRYEFSSHLVRTGRETRVAAAGFPTKFVLNMQRELVVLRLDPLRIVIEARRP